MTSRSTRRILEIQHHGANWAFGAKKIEGTVVGELPIRKDLRLQTEEGTQ
jgi:hypothetical protein